MSYAGNIIINDTTHLVGSTLYGTCDTAASTAEKVVSLSGFDALVTGVTIQVKFVNTNTASEPTLKVGTTAAKTIYRYGTEHAGNTPTLSWGANSVVTFTYDGTNWMMVDINPMIEDILNKVYPVGSIYMSVNSANPGILFGGTWEQIQDTFLLAAGTIYSNGATGGSATHTMTTAEMPAHNHGSRSLTGSFNIKNKSTGTRIVDNFEGIIAYYHQGGEYQADGADCSGSNTISHIAIDATHTHNTVGSDTAFSIMPPYLAVNVWKRTA